MSKKLKLSDIKGISFSNSAWYLFYYLGAIKALRELEPNIGKRVKIYCCSGGAFTALLLLIKTKPDDMLNEWKRIVKNKHDNEWLLSRLNICLDYKKFFSDFLEKKINLNLFNNYFNVSVSKITYNTSFPFIDKKNVIVNKFSNKDELLQTILQSGYLPFIIGYKPTLDGYFDGGITNDIYLKEIDRPDFLNFGLKNGGCNCTICFDNSINKYFTQTPDDLDKLFNIGYTETINYFKK